MMKRAGRVHGLRSLGLVLLVSLITWGGIEGYGTLRASALVESLQKVDTPEVPAIVKQLSGYRRWVDPRLVRAGQSPMIGKICTPALPSSPSMPPRLITSSTACSKPLQANFPCCVMP